MECSTFMAEVQVPETIKEVEAESLYAALKRVKDKRSRRGKRYPAAVVLTLLVLAKLAGQVKLSGIAEWVKWQAETLAKRLPLFRGKVPCTNTYRYVSEQIDVDELNEVLGEYFARVTSKRASEGVGSEQAVESPSVEQRTLTHLALDGKSLRGTRRGGEASKAAVHTVGLYNVTAHFMWQQQAVVGKGQERKAAMALIEPLALHGSGVSADALHTQPQWAQMVLDRGGEYLLMAKGNQSELRAAIALLFSQPPPSLSRRRGTDG